MSGTRAEHTHVHEERSNREVMIILSGLLLAMFLAALDQTIVSTALTTIVSDLEGSSHLSWVVTAYLLTSTAVTPLYGKIGDLYGRKKIFLTAISIFLVGSALCGAAQNMTELIAFRALQGLGAGGLFTLSITIIGDLVPPQQRSKFQGLFGAVFGLSSVIGPLIGGLFTEHLSWRWVFYVNLPVGAIALLVITTQLHLPKFRNEHRIDYLGAAALVGAVTSILLALVWGGGHASRTVQSTNGPIEIPFTGYAWTSATILGLLVLGVGLIVAFLLQERRHPEPILPLELFKNRVFSTSTALSFMSGVGMFGAIIFLPQYLQIVRGFSPTEAGLLMIPMTVGVISGSVGSGRIVSKIGRYKIFPVIGTAILTAGFGLLSLITIDINMVFIGLFMMITGFGLGLFMQITVIAVQNDVEFRYMGTATSSVTFFRTLGGSFGTAAFGTILNDRIRFTLPQYLSTDQINNINLEVLQHNVILRYGPQISEAMFNTYAKAVHVVFLWAVPVSAIAFLIALALPDHKLRQKTAMQEAREGGAVPPMAE